MTIALVSIREMWSELRAAGSERYAEEALNQVNEAFERYRGALESAKSAADPARAFESAIESVVADLNRIGGLDGEFGNIIETDEREVLVPAIISCAEEAGARFEAGHDPTERFRTW